jgi:PPP family 3-phenylpropionic acid transporter
MFSPSPYAWNAQYLFGFFFCYGVYLPFWAVWLAHQGASPEAIGGLIGLGLAVRCFVNLVITPRWNKRSQLLPALQKCAWLALIFCALHLLVEQNNLITLALVTILFNLAIGPIIPLSDAVVNDYAKQGKLDYGRTRLWGSFAFIVGSFCVGLAVKVFDASIIPYVAVVGMAITASLSLRRPSVPLLSENAQISKDTTISLWKTLKSREVLKFLLLVALLQGSHAAYYSFSALYWQSLGMGEGMIGALWSVSVLVEIAVFALSYRWFAHWSIPKLFWLAGIGVVIRWSMVAVFTDWPVLVLAQGFHGITFAVAHLATIRYIQMQPSDEHLVWHALYNALPLGAIMALMTAISGGLYTLIGEHVFWLMALMGVPALIWPWSSMQTQDAIKNKFSLPS